MRHASGSPALVQERIGSRAARIALSLKVRRGSSKLGKSAFTGSRMTRLVPKAFNRSAKDRICTRVSSVGRSASVLTIVMYLRHTPGRRRRSVLGGGCIAEVSPARSR